LTEILEALETGTGYTNKARQPMEIGVSVLPHFPKDSTDRNRTSPVAFTGNRFEFRMPGAVISIADPNIVLNTIAAEVLCQFADSLETSKDFTGDLAKLIKKTFSAHKRIIFNGNNYSHEWITQAEERRLSNLKTTVDALPAFTSKKSIELFTRHNVFSETELHSRCEILMEAYCKTLHIEALTMVNMVKGNIIPACVDYQNDLVKLLKRKKACEARGTSIETSIDTSLEEHLLGRIAALSSSLLQKLTALENAIVQLKEERELFMQASFYRDSILTAMSDLRFVSDELETLVARKHWPFPVYGELLFSVI
jgi:glutamine synthetase